MKFKPIDSNTYKQWQGEPLICVDSGWRFLTKGKIYLCADSYKDGTCKIRADDGEEYFYNKTAFRRVSDIVDTSKDEKESEIKNLKDTIFKQEQEIIRLRRENALLARIHDLEKILEEA